MCIMQNRIFNKAINKGITMKKVFKLTLAASFFAVLTGCGGGGGGGGISSQSTGDNTAAELAQKIRNSVFLTNSFIVNSQP
jgi:hypothetical protein